MTNAVWVSTVHDNGGCIWTENLSDFNPATRCVWTSTVHANGGCIWIEGIISDRQVGGAPWDDRAQILREDDEILAVIMAATLH